MAKKTVKKQPLKAAAKSAVKSATKTVAKTVAKLVKKVGDAAKSKPSKPSVSKVAQKKTVKKTDKKADLKKAKDPVVTMAKNSVEKASKVKSAVKVVEEKLDTPEITVSDVIEETAPTKVKSAKVKAPKKMTAAQKKKEKMEIDSNAKWADLFEKYKQVKPVSYSMRDVFEANQPIQHKVLGWGWVMSSENDRLEVLFKDGKKILISNYKA